MDFLTSYGTLSANLHFLGWIWGLQSFLKSLFLSVDERGEGK